MGRDRDFAKSLAYAGSLICVSVLIFSGLFAGAHRSILSKYADSSVAAKSNVSFYENKHVIQEAVQIAGNGLGYCNFSTANSHDLS
jgi:hypothetical protein